MCGIFGVISGNDSKLMGKDLQPMVDLLGILSESRGKEASGLAILADSKLTVYKQPIRSAHLIRRSFYQKLFDSIQKPLAIIGHSRLVTNGSESDNYNNQPVIAGPFVGIHNGIITNDIALWKRVSSKIKRQYAVDTEVILSLINTYYKAGTSFAESVKKTFDSIEGSASIAVFSTNSQEMILATNTGSLYLAKNKKSKLVMFASERYILETFLREFKISSDSILHISPMTGALINVFTRETTYFSFKQRAHWKNNKQPSTPMPIEDVSQKDPLESHRLTIIPSSINSITKLKKHVPPYAAIANIRRCTRCIMPETIPFISFDANGICNFCREHKKIRYKGKAALERIVAPYRSTNGQPDCIVAFSGGRDSSFGLHYLKTVLKMNPIAYTYDWGMVTDIGRRNEARLVGRLGVEHVIVSADIRKKRHHIKKNILAWVKRPDLGMVPLFMEGDKQCEYYANDLKEKMKIPLIFFCRGNELEDEKFKYGYTGVYHGTPKGVLHYTPVGEQLKLIWHYAKNYMSNPSYINSSIFDTLFAYFSTYLIPHNYIFLWHYIPWDEKTIISTLKKEYNWETPPDTIVTWRSDAGTAAFYNYIYLIMQGATEHDGFRSNQIREGIITRQKALSLVNEENKPHYEQLRWYFDIVGLDGDQILSKVDNAPKRYKS